MLNMRSRWEIEGRRAFTLVELLLVMIISLILIAGLIGLVNMSMNMFTTSRNVQAITDTGRMVTSAIVRQLQGALRLAKGSPDCTLNKVTFWADVDGEAPYAESRDTNDPDDWDYLYKRAPKIEFYEGSDGTVVQRLTRDPETYPNAVRVESVIGSYVDELNFYYYPYGTLPNWNDIANDAHLDPADPNAELHRSVGLVAIELKMKRGRVSRTFRQNVFLRCYNTEY